ncbi:MAG: hypothetical protein M3410_08280 [Acidobacteriota bacterium]|nr:hypothetical protein [Acidobacteriota bacterium]
MVTAAIEKGAPKTDPELLRQISAARSSKKPVVGIFRLRPEDSTKLINSPQRTKEIVHDVFDRVAQKVGTTPQRLNVLGNLGVVVVSAEPRFMSELLKQPEIFSAMANHPSESGKIEPINKRRVSESEIDTPVKHVRPSKSASTRVKSRYISKSKTALKRASKKR